MATVASGRSSVLTPTELKKLAKLVIDAEKGALYGDGESDAQRLNRLERLILDECKRVERG